MKKQTRRVFEFDQFRLDIERGRLLRAGEIIPLPPKAISLLQSLLEHQGQVVEKETILETLWPDTVVEDSNLTQTVHLLRKALGKYGAPYPRIENIPKVGYRLVAEARELSVQDDELAVNLPAPVQEAGAAIAPPIAQESDELEFQESDKTGLVVKTQSGFRAFLRAFVQMRITKIFTVALAGVILGVCLRIPFYVSKLSVKSVAVLPFSLLNAEGDDLSLGLGIADSLITKLSSAGVVEIRPTAAVRGYHGNAFDPLNAGRELGVEAVVTGHVLNLNGRLRVTVQLLRVVDGRTLWAGKFEESLTNLFELEDTIADQVAAALAAHRRASPGFINFRSVIYSFLALTHVHAHKALAKAWAIYP